MIYVHVPFCHRKCTYCAFYSVPSARLLDDYVDALLSEVKQRRGEQPHPIRTVYFGGGTPSLLPAAQLTRVVEGLRSGFDLTQVDEATIECNPEDLTPAYLGMLADLHFFNRISIGIQSLDDRMLRLLGRRHTARQALEAVARAHAAGFRNISVDFIYGLPLLDGSTESWELAEIQEYITHVSAYALTVEEGTALAVQVGQGRVALPDDDEVVRQYHALRKRLEAAGLHQYEVSNYARPGCHSRHNSRYWDRTPYLGLGPGAHSFDGRCRRWNLADLKTYIDALHDAGGKSGSTGVTGKTQSTGYFSSETLTDADACNELIMTALRTVRGLSLAALPTRWRGRVRTLARPYVDCGWLVAEGDTLRPTAEGLLHADGMAVALWVNGEDDGR